MQRQYIGENLLNFQKNSVGTVEYPYAEKKIMSYFTLDTKLSSKSIMDLYAKSKTETYRGKYF